MTRDRLDDLLDDPAPLPDDGFTQRVMEALPTRRRTAGRLDRWLPLLGAGAAGAALAPDLAELANGLAVSALQAGQGAAAALASAAGGGPGGPLTVAAGLMVAVAVAAAAVGSWLVAERA